MVDKDPRTEQEAQEYAAAYSRCVVQINQLRKYNDLLRLNPNDPEDSTYLVRLGGEEPKLEMFRYGEAFGEPAFDHCADYIFRNNGRVTKEGYQKYIDEKTGRKIRVNYGVDPVVQDEEIREEEGYRKQHVGNEIDLVYKPEIKVELAELRALAGILEYREKSPALAVELSYTIPDLPR